MIRRLLLYIAFSISYNTISFAQEVVTGLATNPALYNLQKSTSLTKGMAADTLELPFFDDFSGKNILPFPGRWSDNNVYINNTYSDQQITMGMATFDAIDNSGKLYETASTASFEADKLTSVPLNMNYSPTAEIWFSFWYQPGGFGDQPEANDSLTLQFYAPSEDKWYSVWRTGGAVRQKFKPVIFRIGQTRFLKKGFRFRFINWATLSANMNDPSMVGNCDNWNIDYVKIGAGRNASDTTMADVSFRTPVRSILKTHEAMPWRQFRQVSLQEMGSAIPIHYRNNDIITRNVTRNFILKDVYRNTVSYSFSAGATNISPETNVDYNANLIYTFNTTYTDSALFAITCYLITDIFDPKSNDTIKYNQVFGNYFAFDDGSAEAGYGVNGLGSRNAMVAYRFKSFMRDTIRAVQICFNDSYLNSNRRAFDIMIWDDNNGLPGNAIYSLEDMIVEPEERLNGFNTYILPDGVMVDDVFYIGWKQRSETFINAGFDMNTPHRGRQFYWLNGEWIQSQKPGSIMIRPVLGPELKTTSSDDIVIPAVKSTYRLWPNPATGYITIDCKDLLLSGEVSFSFIDSNGREVLRSPYNEIIDITTLKEGFYLVVTTLNGMPRGYNKLVKTR